MHLLGKNPELWNAVVSVYEEKLCVERQVNSIYLLVLGVEFILLVVEQLETEASES